VAHWWSGWTPAIRWPTAAPPDILAEETPW
jgi:hypothetical protein